MRNDQHEMMMAELVPPRILPRVLSSFDLVAIYFALIFGSYGAAQMSGQGWAGVSMMTLAAITFLLPCALAAYELGTVFPGEGGIYIWAHKAFGPIHGFIAGWLSWVAIFQLLPLGATTIVAHLQVAFHVELSLANQVILQVAVIWGVVAFSLRRLEVSQRFVRWMFFVSLGTAVCAFLAGLLAHPGSGTPLSKEVFSVDLSKYGALYSAAILWLLGVEIPFNMGAEFSDHKKTAGRMLLWGSLALLIGYYLGIAGILMSTHADAVDGTTGVARAAASISPILGTLVGLAICFAVASQDVSYMNAYSRLLFISGIERRLPALMGQVSERTRVPIAAMLVQGLGATVVVLIFSTQTNLAVAFNIYLASLVAVWCASLFYLYPGVVRTRQRFPQLYADGGQRVWRIPGGRIGAIGVAIWGTIFNAVAVYYVFAAPWTKDIDPREWRVWLFAISGMIVLSGLAVFLRSERGVRPRSVEEEVQHALGHKNV